MKNKLIFIGLDGADWKILFPLIKDGYLKALGELLEDGVYGTLEAIPPITLPSWTSILTGRNPGWHGIFDQVIKHKGSFVPALSRFRKVATIWEKASKLGLEIININDPITYPAPSKINGIFLTGFLTPPKMENFIYPRALREEINRVTHGYWADVPAGFYYALKNGEYSLAYKIAEVFVKKIGNLALYLGKNYQWDLFFVFFTAIDRLQHFFLGGKNEKYVRSLYIAVDNYIKKILNRLYDSDTYLVIASDHGFDRLTRVIMINNVLFKLGLIPFNEFLIRKIAWDLSSFCPETLIKELRGIYMNLHFQKKERRENNKKSSSKSGCYGYSPTGISIYINSACKDTKKIHLKRIVQFLSNLPEKNAFEIYNATEIFRGPLAYKAPEIILVPKKEIWFSPSISLPPNVYGELKGEGIKITGEHTKDGIFIVSAPHTPSDFKTKKLKNWQLGSWINKEILKNK